jgi:hypothetical protein
MRTWCGLEIMNTPIRSGPSAVSTSRRLVLALALLPIVPTVSVIGVAAILDYAPALVRNNPNVPLGITNIDELQWFHAIFAVLWVTATIFIWRGAILWTLGREWLTALVSVIPFIQVIYGDPLWTMPGCRFFDDEILRIGQFQMGAGLFVWLTVWAWWGTEKLIMKAKHKRALPVVGALGPPLAMAIGLQPIVFAAFLINMQALQDFAGITNITAVFGLTAVMAVAGWLFIWRAHLPGAGCRAWVVAAMACLGVPLAVQWRWLAPPGAGFIGALLLCLPIIGWGIFMAGTIVLWPLRDVAIQEDGPRCLRCGYSLRGLKATRCPECGDEPTLDQLWGVSA